MALRTHFLRSCRTFGEKSLLAGCSRNFHGSAICQGDKPSGQCIEKCNKRQLETKSALGGANYKFLQPSTKQLTGRKFRMSPPVINPKIDVTLEEDCRLKEECNKLKQGKSKK